MEMKKWWKRLLLVAVFGVIGFFYFRDLDKHPLQSDEHEWVRRGILFSELFFIDLDYANPMWFRFESLDMPKLGQYLYGIWLRGFYGEDMSELMEKTNFNSGWKREDGYGLLWDDRYWWVNGTKQSISENFEAFSMIVSARYMSVIFTLFGMMLFYKLLSKFVGILGGLIAVALLSSNAVFFEVTRQALLDGPLFFGIMLAFAGMILIIKKTANWKQEVVLLAGSSFLFGVGALIKLNGLLLIPVGFMTMLLLEIGGLQKIRKAKLKTIMLRYVLVACLLFGAFWVSDPLWWPDPGKAMFSMLDTRVRLARAHSNVNWAEPLTSLSSRFLYPIQTYHNGSLFLRLHFNFIPMKIFLMIAGFLTLLLDMKVRKNTVGVIFVVGSIIWFFVVMSYLSMGISRHAIVLTPFLALLEARGILMIFEVFWRMIRGIQFRYRANS
jgi:hypothetical protein